MKATKKMLFVCMGNICRSPLAHAYMEKLLEQPQKTLQYSYHIDSAGMGAWHSGEKADSRMRQTALKHGLEIKHKAQGFKKSFADDFDYIFAMDRTNYKDILSKIDANINTKAKVLLFRTIDTIDTSSDEVPDPYYGGEQGFENVYTMVERNCKLLLKAIENGDI